MTDDAAGEAISLLSEELRVEKRNVATGKVRVRSVVDAVEEVARATLEEQRVEVTRVPVNQEVAEAPSVRTEGDTVIVPVLEEILIVEKRLVLREELHIRRRISHENVEVPVTLRKQRAVIEHVAADGQTCTDEEAIR